MTYKTHKGQEKGLNKWGGYVTVCIEYILFIIILTINGCVSFAVIFREEERRGDL